MLQWTFDQEHSTTITSAYLLDSKNILQESFITTLWCQIPQLVQVHHPVLSNSLKVQIILDLIDQLQGGATHIRDDVREGRVTEAEPSPRGNPIGLVLKLVRTELIKVLEQGLSEEVRVNGSHSIDSMGSHDGQVGHVHSLLRLLLYDGQHSHPVHVARVTFTDSLSKH